MTRLLSMKTLFAIIGLASTGVLSSSVEGNRECADHDDCATHLSCVDHHCVDPCEGRCGINTMCNVTQHIPKCACTPGATGNVISGCELKDISRQHLFSSTKKKIYEVVSDFKYDWKSSNVHCRRNNGYLAIIENEEENNRILELINATGLRNTSFWVGGSYRTVEGDWIWATTGRPIEGYTNWKDNNPDNGGTWDNAGNEHCLSYWEKFSEGKGYRWNDDRCSTEYQFICEYYKGNYNTSSTIWNVIRYSLIIILFTVYFSFVKFILRWM